MYSDYAVESSKIVCLILFHDTAAPLCMNMDPVVERRISSHPAQCASKNADKPIEKGLEE